MIDKQSWVRINCLKNDRLGLLVYHVSNLVFLFSLLKEILMFKVRDDYYNILI